MYHIGKLASFQSATWLFYFAKNSQKTLLKVRIKRLKKAFPDYKRTNS